MQISVIIIAKNEEDNLRRSLPKLSWCEDIIVVDDNSTDNTVAVAELFGAKVYGRTFDGYGPQKKFGISKARFDWILNIDADEVLTDALIDELRKLDLESGGFSGFEIPVRHVFMGKVFRHGKESRFYHLRLFNRHNGDFNSATVHEKVEVDGKTGRLSNVILHYSYKDLDHYFYKFNIYTSVGARNLKAKGKSRSLLLCLAAFPFYFVKHFFVYGNILNGRPGFIWSYLNAWYHTVKYLKLYELNRKS